MSGYASKYSTYKRYVSSTEVSYASHTSRQTYQQESATEYSSSKGVTSSTKEVISGTDTRSLPVFIAIQDYRPDANDKDALPLEQGQVVEVLDNKNSSAWLVRTKSRPPETGWVPGSYFESPTEYYQQKRTTAEITADGLATTKQEEAIRKRDSVFYDLMKTEEKFVAELRHVIDHYVTMLDEPSTPHNLRPLRDQLFLNFRDLYNFHANVLLKGLQYYADDPGKVGQTFVRLERDFDHHVKYCHDEPEAEKLLNDPKVKEFFDNTVRQVESSSGKTLVDYLHLPLQRLEEYQRYIKDLIKYTVRAEKDTKSLQRALELMLSIPQRATDLSYIRNIQQFPGDTVKLGRLLRHEQFRVWEGIKDGEGEVRYVFLFKNKLVLTIRKDAEDPDDLPEFEHAMTVRLEKYDVQQMDENTLELRPLDVNLPALYLQPIGPAADSEAAQYIKTVWVKHLGEAKESTVVEEDETETMTEFVDLSDVKSEFSERSSLSRKGSLALGDEGAPPRKKHRTPPAISPSMSTQSIYSSSLDNMTTSGTLEMQGTRVTKTQYGFRTLQESSAKMCLKVTGYPLPIITWFKDGEQLLEDDRHAFYQDDEGFFAMTIEPVKIEDTGRYTCVATNEYGQATTSAFFRVVKMEKEPQSPKFVSELRDINIKEGAAAAFECEVEGWPEPDLQWLIDGELIYPSQDFKIEYDGQKARLEIKDAQPEDAGVYTVRIVNDMGTKESNARLAVEEDPDKQKVPPEFQKKPDDAEAKEGDTVRFKAVITGDPPPEVIWHINGSPLTASQSIDLLAEDGIYILTIRNVPIHFDGEVLCRAVNRLGEAAATAHLTVFGTLIAPEFDSKKKLTDQVVTQGDALRLEVGISGEPAPDVTWTLNGKKVETSSNVSIIADADNNTYALEIKKVGLELAGELACIAENEVSEIRQTMKLAVKKYGQAKPEFQSKLAPIEVSEGDTLRVKLLIAGEPEAKVKWYINNKLVAQTEDVQMIAEDGVYILTIQGASTAMSGEIKCVAFNKMGETTCTAPLTVTPQKIPVEFEQYLSDTVCREGDTLKLKAVLIGEPNPEVTWYINKKKLEPTHNVQILKDSGAYMVLIRDITCDYSGEVLCKAVNEFGEATSSAHLTVLPRGTPPDFTEWLSNVSTAEGGTVVLRVVFTGDPTPAVTWLLNGVELSNSSNLRIVTKDGVSTLTMKNFTREMSGEICCKAENDAGEVSCTAQLQFMTKEEEIFELSEHSELEAVAMSGAEEEDDATDTAISIAEDEAALDHEFSQASNAPHFITKMKDTRVRRGHKALFECIVPESKGIVVKWLKDGSEIELVTRIRVRSKVSEDGQAIAHQLIIDKVSAEDKGKYTCVISNEHGTELCSAELEVEALQEELPVEVAPEFTKLLENCTAREGFQATFECKVTGAATPKIEWYKDGKKVALSKRVSVETTEDGMQRLIVKETTVKDAGVYQVVVSTATGSIKSQAELIVEKKAAVAEVAPMEKAPEFVQQMQACTVDEGQTAQLECQFKSATKQPAPEVHWYKDSVEIKQSEHIIMEVTRKKEESVARLTVKEATLTDVGQYACELVTASGTARTAAPLQVNKAEQMEVDTVENVAPHFVSQLDTCTATIGEAITLECVVQGTPTPDVHWYQGKTEIKSDARHKITAMSDGTQRLEIKKVAEKDLGEYRCEASNDAGAAHTEAAVQLAMVMEVDQANEIAPAFTVPLKAQNAVEGETVTLECKAAGQPLPTVHWYKDGDEVKTDERHTVQSLADGTQRLVIVETVLTDIGQYRCEAINIAGTAHTHSPLQVKVAEQRTLEAQQVAPEFTSVLHEQKAKEGESVVLECSVVGQPAPDVRWFKGKQEIVKDARHEITSVEDGTQKLVIYEAQQIDVGEYRCEATNVVGKAKTEASLQVATQSALKQKEKVAPSFVSTLHSQSAAEGEAVALECAIAVTAEAAKIQWYKDEKPLRSDATHVVESLPDGTQRLTIKQAAVEDIGQYRCEAVSSAGRAETRGDLEVKVAVEEQMPSAAELAPEFVSALSAVSAKEGETVKLECAVKCEEQPEVHWYKGKEEIKPDKRHDIVTEPDGHLKLVVKEANLEDVGEYRCEVVTSAGKAQTQGTLKGIIETLASIPALATSTAVALVAKQVEEKVRMETAPEFVDELKTVSAKQGETVELECAVKCESKPEVHWYKGKEEIKPDKRHDIVAEPDGHLKLVVKEATLEDIGEYRCEVVTAAGKAQTQGSLKVAKQVEEKMQIETAPEFVDELKTVSAKQGETVELECAVKCESKPEVHWYKGKEEIKPDKRHDIVAEPDGHLKLVVKEATLEDIGEYRCEVVTAAGKAQTQGSLKGISETYAYLNRTTCTAVALVAKQVEEKMQIETAPEFVDKLKTVSAKQGETVELECAVKCESKPEVHWYKGKEEIKPDKRHDIVAEPDGHLKLVVKEATLEDIGEYRCEVVTAAGKAQTQGSLKVAKQMEEKMQIETAPEFVDELKAVSAKQGETVELECAVKCESKPEVHWYKGKEEIKPDKRHDIVTEPDGHLKLVVKEATLEDIGEYRCEVVTAAGKAQTQGSLKVAKQVEEKMQMETAPEFVDELKAVSAKQGETVELECAVKCESKPEVHWYKGKEEIKPDKRHDIVAEPDGHLKLVVKEATLEDIGEYRCEVVTAAGKAQTQGSLKVAKQVEEKMQIETAPEFVDELKAVSAKQGETVELECAVKCESKPEVHWYKGKEEIKPDKRHDIVAEPDGHLKLVVKEATLEDIGEYRCEVVTAGGKAQTVGAVKVAKQVSESTKVEVAPEFVTPLHAITAGEGDTVALECAVRSDSKVEVHWYKGDQEVKKDKRHEIVSAPDGTQKLIIKQALINDVDEYRCEAVSAAGSAKTTGRLDIKIAQQVTEEVSENTAPEFVEILRSCRATVAETATFACRVTAKPAAQVKWFKNGEEVKPSTDGRVEVLSLPDGLQQLILHKTELADAGEYRCEASNDFGNAWSEAPLMVKVAGLSEVENEEIAPDFIQPLSACQAEEGEEVELRCQVSGVPAPDIRWFKDGEEIKASDHIIVKAAPDGTQTVTLHNVLKEDMGEYRCEAVNVAGTTWSDATLVVQVAEQHTVEEAQEWAPEFVRELREQKVEEGEDVVFECRITAQPPAAVKWYKDGKPLQADKQHEVKGLSDGTQQLIIHTARAEDQGNYRCEATNAAGSMSSKAPLTVHMAEEMELETAEEEVAPVFVQKLKECRAEEGGQAALECIVAGVPAPQVVWYKNGEELEASDHVQFESLPDGRQKLIISQAASLDAGEYQCIAANKAGEARSAAPVQVETKETKPSFSRVLKNVKVNTGRTVTMECQVNLGDKKKPNAMPQVQWMKDGKVVAMSKHITAKESADGTCTLTIAETVTADAGTYSCIITNKAGSATTEATLTVTEEEKKAADVAAAFTKMLEDVAATEDETVKLVCEVAGKPTPEVKWYKNGKEIKPDDRIKIACDGGVCSLQIAKSVTSDAGSYTVKIKNSAGAAESTASLVVNPAALPAISFVRPLEDTRETEGEKIVLVVEVDRKPKSVKWYKAGKELKADKRIRIDQLDDTRYQLTIEKLNADDEGEYAVVADDSRSQCQLGVDAIKKPREEEPSFTTPLQDISVPAGDVIELKAEVKGKPKTVKWYKNGKALKPDGKRVKAETTEGGQISLVVLDAASEDCGVYKVEVANDAGSVSCDATVVVEEPEAAPVAAEAHLTIEKGLEDTNVDSGASAELSATFSGEPYNVMWYKNGRELKPDGKRVKTVLSGRTATLSITAAATEDNATYKIAAFNSVSSASSEAALTVKEPVSDSTAKIPPKQAPTEPAEAALKLRKGLSDLETDDACSAELSAVFDGVPKEVKWYKNGKEIKADGAHIVISTDGGTARLLITASSKSDEGEYKVVAANSVSTISTKATLSVREREELMPEAAAATLTLTKPLEDVSTVEDLDVTLSAQVSGQPTEAIWYKNGSEFTPDGERVKATLSPDGVAELIISAAQKDDEGFYKVEFKDENNAVVSQAALVVDVKPGAPLSLVKPLSDQTAADGKRAIFEARFSAEPESVKWLKNGKPLTASKQILLEKVDECTYQLIVPSVGKDDDATYTIKATSKNGNADSEAKLTVKGEPPKVVKGLQDKDLTVNAKLILEVEVTGKPKSVKWYKAGKELSASKRIQIEQTDEQTYRLVIDAVKIEDKGDYKVELQNDYGSDESSGKVSVAEPKPPAKTAEPLTIVRALEDQEVPDGEKAVLEVELSRKPKEIKWYKNGQELKPDNKRVRIEPLDDRTHRLLILKAQKDDDAVYSVRATSDTGETTSSEAALKVKGFPPRFIKGLVDKVFLLGATVVLDVEVEGKPNQVKWYRAGKEVTATKAIKIQSDADAGVYKLILSDATAEHAGQYRVEATNAYGDAKSEGKLSLQEPEVAKGQAPTLMKGLNDKSVMEGEKVAFEVALGGGKPKEVKWYRNGRLLKPSQKAKIEQIDDFTYRLTLPDVSCDDAAIYKVEASNDQGAVTSQASLTVKEAPRESEGVAASFVIPLKDVLVDEEESVSLTCKIAGEPAPEITWYKDGMELTANARINLSSTADGTCRLQIKKALASDAGTYAAFVKNAFGSDRCECSLTISAAKAAEVERPEPDQAPEFVKGLRARTIIEGDEMVLDVRVTGKPMPDICWYHNDREVKPSGRITGQIECVADEVAFRLSVKDFSRDDVGVYRCVATNRCGEATTQGEMSVERRKAEENTPPKFVIPLRDAVTTEGKTLALDLKVRGRPTPQLRWLKDGKPLEFDNRVTCEDFGDNRWRLTIRDAVPEDDGYYECVAENPLGSDKCRAELTVNPAKERKKPGEEQYAPTFTVPLHDRKVPHGNIMAVECFVNAKPTADIKWYRDGVLLEEDERTEILTLADGKCRLRISNFTKEYEGSYRCVATNALGSANTRANLSVEIIEQEEVTKKREYAPRFLEDLRNKTVKNQSAVVMQCKVDGVPRPSIAWFRDGMSVKLDSNVTTEYAEDGTCRLSISSASSTHEGAYRCVATNEHGSCSTVGTLTVQVEKAAKKQEGEAPQFVVGLKAASVDVDGEATMKCVVTGLPTPTVKWYKDGVPLRAGGRVRLAQLDDGSCVLTITEARQSDEGLYRCFAENTVGTASTLGQLNVTTVRKGSKLELPTGEAPRFVVPLEDMSVVEGSTVELECKVTGVPLPGIKLFKDGAQLKSNHRVSIETLADGRCRLTIRDARQSDDGTYRCVAANEFGTATSKSRMIVGDGHGAARLPAKAGGQIKPRFAVPLGDVRAVEGTPLKIECKIDGFPVPEVQWFKDGEPVVPSDRVRMELRSDGTCGLWIPNCRPEDAGTYRCVATSPLGTDTSRANVVVKPALPTLDGYDGAMNGHEISKDRAPRMVTPLDSLVGREGASVTFTCKFTGFPTPSIKWFKDGERIYPFGRHEMRQHPDGTVELVINDLTQKDAGCYRCLAENDLGNAQTRAQLNMQHKAPRTPVDPNEAVKRGKGPGFSKPLYVCRVQENGTAVFECVPFGTPAPSISWLKDGMPMRESERVKIEVLDDGTHRLTITGAAISDEGFYRCVATNEFGLDSTKAELIVETDFMKKLLRPPQERQAFLPIDVDDQQPKAPRFRRPLYNLTVTEGQTAEFECLIAGVPKPRARWFKGAEELTNDARHLFWTDEWGIARLVILNSQAETDEAEYRCEIFNEHGSATCDASLTVLRDKLRKLQEEMMQVAPRHGLIDTGRHYGPGFLKQLRNKHVYAGTPAIFDVVVCGCPAPEVQWLHNGVPFTPNERVKIQECGGGSFALVIFKAQPEDAGEYSCVARNSVGSACSLALLEVTVPFDKLGPFEDAEDTRRIPFEDFLMRRSAYSGIPTPPDRGPFIAECTDHFLTLSWIPTKRMPPRYPQVTYIVEMRELPDKGWSMVDYNIPQPCCKVRNLENGCSYQFRVRAENIYGISDPSPPSPPSQLMAKPKPVLDKRKRPIPNYDPYTREALDKAYAEQYACAPWFAPPESPRVFCALGASIEVVLWVYGFPDPNVKWCFRGWEVDSAPPSRFKTSVLHGTECVLKITAFSKEDAGQYQCMAVNDHGDAQQNIFVEVAEMPTFIQPLENKLASVGKAIKLDCRVDGNPFPEVKWFKDWRPLVESSRVKINKEPPYLCSLTITDPILRDTGIYTCVAANEAGKVSTSATLTVQAEPSDAEIEPPRKKVMLKTKKVRDLYEIEQETDDEAAAAAVTVK